MAGVLSYVHAIPTTCSMCWTSLCTACRGLTNGSCIHMYCLCVCDYTSTVPSILISDLINKYDSLTLAPNMPCMLLTIQYKWIIIITARLRLLYILLWTGNKHTITCSGLISGVWQHCTVWESGTLITSPRIWQHQTQAYTDYSYIRLTKTRTSTTHFADIHTMEYKVRQKSQV